MNRLHRNSHLFAEAQLNAHAKALRSWMYLGLCVFVSLTARIAQAQAPVIRIDLPIGRSYPLTTPTSITRVSISNPDVADIVVVGTRELVINAKTSGETDAILWLANGSRQHYRISVHSPSDRMQVAIYIKIAEVRKDALRNIGVSGVWRNGDTRVGTGIFRSDDVFGADGKIRIPSSSGFLTVLSDFGTKNLLAFLEAEESRGRAHTLAEPNLLAGNKEEATFLAGGELPIPIVQGGGDLASNRVTIQYKEFGVRLRFLAEIVSDSLIKLAVRPEVSSLDFVNSVLLSGFRIPAFRTRRVETTVDVRRDQSMIISGLFNSEDERVRSGVPYLKDLPIIGSLFGSTRYQKNESELLIVVTPVIVDPMDPRPQDILHLVPDTALPARDAIKKKLLEGPSRPPSPIIR
ncbi:MAG TPA: pilus assembly protein N-terminal domain-containing protein [Gemmatimonadaceae bacterium]